MIMLRKQQVVDGVIGIVKMNSRRFHTHIECENNPQDRYWCGYCDRKGLKRISVNTDMILDLLIQSATLQKEIMSKSRIWQKNVTLSL